MENPLNPLVATLARLPGLGSRSAERAALALVRRPGGLLADLIKALEKTRDSIRCCELCGAVTSREQNPCRLCLDSSRRPDLLCVVEEPGDILAMERSGAFPGRYHALMGRVSPARGTGTDDLRVQALLDRVEKGGISEVVLALNTDVDGDATAALIVELLRPSGVGVSRLAFGLPVGSGVGYADPVTLKRAISGRVAF